MSEKSLPIDWLQTTLGTVVAYGKTTKVAPGEVSDGTWVLELEDIEKDSSRLLKKVSYAERKSKSTKNAFEKGDVLYGKLRPYLNKVIVAQDDGVCTTEIIPLNGAPHLDNHFLFYWLKSPEFLGYVSEVGYGVNMPRLGTKDGIAAPFLLPPLAEQKEIARQLDDLLARVDTLKTRLDTIPAILKRFRQATLAAAVSGKLTEEWRGENSVSSPTTKSIKEVVTSLDQGWSPKCINRPAQPGEWAVIKTSSVQEINFVAVENKKLPASLEARHLLGLKKGDILITRAGPRVRCGVTCIVEADFPNLMICDKVYRVRTDHRQALPMFLTLLLNSPQYLDEIERLKTGISESGLNLTQKKFYQLTASFPVVAEQAEIVRRVEELFAFADQIEQRVRDAQARAEKLTQSVLAKAFRGDLTESWRAANPDLITGQNSAEALLERIKKEREKMAPKKKTRKERG